MTEQLHCLRCSRPIQPATARATGGLCRPCDRGMEFIQCSVCGKRTTSSVRGPETEGMCTTCLGEKLRMRPTEIEEFVKGSSRDCSLLVRLFKLDERLRFERKDHFIGLNLIDPPERDREEAPLNAIAFAETGGDDILFSLISETGEPGDDCMVVMTVPEIHEDPWAANVAVGENLHDFLCLGCVAGYDALEKLAFYGDKAIQKLQDEETDDPEAAETLRVMREELGLSPWPNVAEKLASLQAAKKFKLRFARSTFFKTQLRRVRNVLRRDD